MGGVGHRRCRPWLLHLRASFLSALVLTSLCYDVLIRARFLHLVALSPAVVDGQDPSISPGRCSPLSSSPSDSLPIVLFTGAWNSCNIHLRSISKFLRVIYHRFSLSARRLSRQWCLDLHIFTSRLQARDPITVHSVNPGPDDIWVLQRKTVFSPHATTSILLLKSYSSLHSASEPFHNHNLDDFLCLFINSELCFVFSVSTALPDNAMFDVFQLQTVAKMFCTQLTPHHGSRSKLLDIFHISDVHGGDLTFGSVSSDILHHQSPKATLRQRLCTQYSHYSNGGGLFWGNTTNPNALKVLLGPYGPLLLNDMWVTMAALDCDELDHDCLILIIHHVLDFGDNLGHDCLILFTHHVLDFEYQCHIILASLSDVKFPVKESTIFSSFTQRTFIPVRVIPVQRLYSRIEKFKTALKGTLIGLLTAASSRSISEKCENSYFKHLGPIEDNFGEHHRRTMCFGSLSFYFSCFIVALFIFYMFIVWFEDAINMDVVTM